MHKGESQNKFDYGIETKEQGIEMKKKNIAIKSLTNADNYFEGIGVIPKQIKNIARYKEHDNKYLLICFFNLLEKYRKGQKDFDKETFDRLYDFVNRKIDLKGLGVYNNTEVMRRIKK